MVLLSGVILLFKFIPASGPVCVLMILPYWFCNCATLYRLFVSIYDTKIGTKNGQAKTRVGLLANDDVVGHVVLW